MKRKLSRQIFEQFSNIKFHENPSVAAKLFHKDEKTTDKLMVAFRNACERAEKRVRLA
jgi:hypothetical protein